MTGPLSISVIVVTADRRDELMATLRLLRHQREAFELVVVDNGSSDGSAEAVRAAWPGARVIALSENKGVSGGRNAGIEAATGDILVFLDDDASFESADALHRIRSRFAADPNLGIVAGHSRLASSGESERRAIPRKLKRTPAADCAVSYFCAVGFAARRATFTAAGRFDEEFRYYCEELDLGWRVIDAGLEIAWAVDLVVLHRVTPVARPRGRQLYSEMRNRVRVALKHLPWRYVASYALLWWPVLFVRAFRQRMLSDYFRGMRDFFRLLPATLRERCPLRQRTLQRIRALDGRLLY